MNLPDAGYGYTRRDRLVGWLANQVLRLASRQYRTMIGGSIRYGLAAAATNCEECRATIDRTFGSH